MFELIESKKNRSGIIKTKNGEIFTPFFMPDATRGFVKSLSSEDLKKIGIAPMVVNTYHLYLQPGMELIKKAHGIHKFMHWDAPLLSDSGGYQIFSLIHKNSQNGKITDEKAIFKSPLDGSTHEITPEKSIQIQFDLGVDMMVVLDDVPPNNYSKEKIKEAVERTIKWAKRCKAEYEKQLKKRKISEDNRPLIFGVIQGGVHSDLRKYCAEELIKIGFDGYGFGARHIDAEGNFMEDAVRETADLIPENSLRFALGVGTPEDIVKFVNLGWDIFDCVIPTREGRHGRLFLWNPRAELSDFKELGSRKPFYETININNEKFKDDFAPVDPYCDCELCQNHTRAYLKHLFASKDLLAMRLASMHNLKFYMELMEKLRKV
ncbi:MAG: tRNA guanosine(34) transglycosylase Tgt [Parcubacteria group bacterium]